VESQLRKLEVFLKSSSDASVELREQFSQLSRTESVYSPIAIEITKLGSSGEQIQAIKLINEQCRPLLEKFIGQIGAFLIESEHIGKLAANRSQAQFESLRGTSLTLSFVAAVLSIFLAISTTRSITQPLAQAAALTEEFAKGNLTQTIAVRGRDEISAVMSTMETMRQSLTVLVNDVRHGAETVLNASVDIAAGNQDLSDRTEQQASALQETAASMEQLNVAVKQNSEYALHAKQLASQATSVAQEGELVAEQVAETMRKISASSTKIHDIVSVIDSIAFQTNILALNAAVEAARAGEEGRGFAVVANEVRVLANRSAESAKEIRALVVKSTEQVDKGALLVNRAGTTMQDIVNSIRRVDGILGEISSASVEQSNGVHQVGQAIVILDQATQQNSALVEQMSAAAAGLQGQASELVRTIAVFETDPQHQDIAGDLGGSDMRFKGFPYQIQLASV